MPFYTITEPHPTVPKNSITHAGRGGAGNMFRAPATTPSSGVPTTSAETRRTGRFYSGRGGAGNAHAAAERPVLSFGEEYALAEAREKASVGGYVGRGGAGNAVGSAAGRKNSDARSDMSSDLESDRSSLGRSGFWSRLMGAHR